MSSIYFEGISENRYKIYSFVLVASIYGYSSYIKLDTAEFCSLKELVTYKMSSVCKRIDQVVVVSVFSLYYFVFF